MLARPLALLVALAALVLGTSEAAAFVHLVVVDPTNGPTPSLDFGTVEELSTSAPQRIRIKNIGTTEPDFHWVEFAFTTAYRVVGQGGSLAPGDTMYFDVVASPGTEEEEGPSGCWGSFHLEWHHPPDDDDGTVYVFVDCMIAPSPYQADPLYFYGVGVGTSKTLTVPVTNAGAVSRVVAGISVVSGPFTTQLHGGTLPITVAPGATFDVDVTYTPDSVPSFPFSQLEIVDGTGPHGACRVSGYAVDVQLALSTTSLAFGDTYRYPSSPPTAEVLVTNVGEVAAAPPTATVTGPGFSLVSGPLGPLAPQASGTYVVAFEPEAAGTFQGALVLGGLGQVALSGQGVLRPVSAVAELDVGTAFVGGSVRSSFLLHNAGATAITVSSLAPGDPRFSVVSPDRTIPPLGALAVEVEYAPTTEGEVTAPLAIALDADPEPQLAVTLRGTGVSLEPPSDPWPGEPPLSFAPGAAPADPAPAAGDSGGCSAHGGSAPLAALALPLALVLPLVPVRRRRRRRPGAAGSSGSVPK